jgi:hypothetical protein
VANKIEKNTAFRAPTAGVHIINRKNEDIISYIRGQYWLKRKNEAGQGWE